MKNSIQDQLLTKKKNVFRVQGKSLSIGRGKKENPPYKKKHILTMVSK